MSKRSLFWGQAAGKLGEAVFYRAGGEQRTRAYVAKVKNPRSLAQQLNRCAMANLASFYRTTKSILAYSMTNRKANQSAFNLFVQKSKGLENAAIDPIDAQRGYNIPIGFCIASGSAAWAANPAVVKSSAVESSFGLALGSGVQGAAAAADSLVVFAGANEAKQAIASMLAVRGSWFEGLPRAFKLTMIGNDYDDDGGRNFIRSMSVDGTSVNDFSSVSAISKNLAVSGDFGVSEYGLRPFGLYTAQNGLQRIAVAVSPNGGDTNGWCIAGAFISYKDENKRVQVSNAYMQLVYVMDDDLLAQYLPGGDVYNSVVQRFGVGETDPLAETATNVAGGATGGGGETPSYVVSLSANNTSFGTVSGAGTYTAGESVQISATAKSGYTFQQWSDGNTSNPRTLVVNSNINLNAVFASSSAGGGEDDGEVVG